MTNDLHGIANARGFGTGKAYRDRKAAEAECLQLLPSPMALPTFIAGPDGMMTSHVPVCHFGYSSDHGEDWHIWHDGVTEADAIGHDAADDARVIAAILNAYRLGVLKIDREDEKK